MLLTTPITPLPHAVTFYGLHWPSAHSSGAPFAHAHARVTDAGVPLSEVLMDDGRPVSHLPLVESIRWDQVSLAVVVRLPNGWETLLVAGTVDGAQVAVSVPTAALRGEGVAPELGRDLACELQILVDSARMTILGDNLDELLAAAGGVPSVLAPKPATNHEPAVA